MRENLPHPTRLTRRRGPAEAGYVITRAIGFGLIWLGILLLGAATVARTLARWL